MNGMNMEQRPKALKFVFLSFLLLSLPRCGQLVIDAPEGFGQMDEASTSGVNDGLGDIPPVDINVPPPILPPSAPPAPTALAGVTSLSTPTRISLSWLSDAAANITEFSILRRIDPTLMGSSTSLVGDEAEIARLPGTSASYTDSDLASGTMYCYRVYAHRDLLASDASSEVCVVTPNLIVIPYPDPPPPDPIPTEGGGVGGNPKIVE